MHHSSPPARLASHGTGPSSVDLEGAKPTTVSLDLGQAAGREGIRAGQPDHQLGVERGDHRASGRERVTAGLDADRPAILDHDPVNPVGGGDHAAGVPDGRG
jgi:hypothetical protein